MVVVVVVVGGWVLSKAVEPCTEQFNQRYKKRDKKITKCRKDKKKNIFFK